MFRFTYYWLKRCLLPRLEHRASDQVAKIAKYLHTLPLRAAQIRPYFVLPIPGPMDAHQRTANSLYTSFLSFQPALLSKFHFFHTFSFLAYLSAFVSNYFTVNSIRLWNKLPASISNAPIKLSFKNQVKKL